MCLVSKQIGVHRCAEMALGQLRWYKSMGDLGLILLKPISTVLSCQLIHLFGWWSWFPDAPTTSCWTSEKKVGFLTHIYSLLFLYCLVESGKEEQYSYSAIVRETQQSLCTGLC